MKLNQRLFQSISIKTNPVYISHYNNVLNRREALYFLLYIYIYVSAKNPFWFSWISVINSGFRRLANTVDNSLNVTFNGKIGLQFFRNSLGLFPLGKIDIIPCDCTFDNIPFFKAILENGLNLTKRIWKILR